MMMVDQVAQFVRDRAFHAIFADNRHLIPPTYPSEAQEWQRYQFYGPPEIGGACINPGSRNTDVLTARVNAELIVSAPTTFKQLNARRGFPIRVQNGTGVDRFYRLTITQGAADASFMRCSRERHKSTSRPSRNRRASATAVPYSSGVVFPAQGARH